MAYQKLTLSDLKQSLADRLTNGSVPADTATLSYWTRLLNRGILYCADRLRISKQITLATSNGTIELPDDFILINKVISTGNVDQIQVDQDDLSLHVGPVFWITGNQVDGFYLNTPTDAIWTIDYSFRPSPLVDNADVCLVPDGEAIVAFAYSRKRKAESDPFEDSDAAMQECDARLKEMQSSYSINDNSIDFTWV